MKYSLWCFLFGHRFAGWREGNKGIVPGWWWVNEGYCLHCGLTKKEVGII